MNFALDGLWLLGGLAVTYLLGVFTAQWAKDKINGVPPALRSALAVTEAAAVKELSAARDKMVADVASLLARGKAAAAAEVKAVEAKVNPAPAPALAAPLTPPTPALAPPVAST